MECIVDSVEGETHGDDGKISEDVRRLNTKGSHPSV